MLDDYNGHMKVKVAELKSRLSHYLRVVQESGEDIEICVRETPVAYLVGCAKHGSASPEARAESARLREALAAVGLAATPRDAEQAPLPAVRPVRVGPAGKQIDTVKEIRQQKEW